jgi:hypothetical protein
MSIDRAALGHVDQLRGLLIAVDSFLDAGSGPATIDRAATHLEFEKHPNDRAPFELKSRHPAADGLGGTTAMSP